MSYKGFRKVFFHEQPPPLPPCSEQTASTVHSGGVYRGWCSGECTGRVQGLVYRGDDGYTGGAQGRGRPAPFENTRQTRVPTAISSGPPPPKTAAALISDRSIISLLTQFEYILSCYILSAYSVHPVVLGGNPPLTAFLTFISRHR